MAYLIVKSLHLIGVIAWFAGLFYIFRLFVYHTENRDNQDICALLHVMERRLYYAITWPAMIFTVVMGAYLIYLNPAVLTANWFYFKLAALVFLFSYHFYSGHIYKEFGRGNFKLSSRQCRMLNEMPTIVLLIVVPLAVIKQL